MVDDAKKIVFSRHKTDNACELTETETAHTRSAHVQTTQNEDKEMALLNNDSPTRKFIPLKCTIHFSVYP